MCIIVGSFVENESAMCSPHRDAGSILQVSPVTRSESNLSTVSRLSEQQLQQQLPSRITVTNHVQLEADNTPLLHK
jgi:hypothetical protein